MNVSKKILEKYNVPVPRYTSYPPANHFENQADPQQYVDLIERSNQWEPSHVAFYVHIPFCKKICFYCGCNACTLKSNTETDQYISALLKEIKLMAKHIDQGRIVTQLHFGGGTPNSIPAAMITGIVNQFKNLYNFSPNAEIAIETNPAYLDETYLDELLLAGFNRFSFGIQDFNEQVLKMVNREPSAIPVEKLISYVKKKNDHVAVNLDFIYGLPGQTPDSFLNTMQQALQLQPDRLVTFSYAHVPWLKKHQQVLEKRGLPGPEEKTQMFLAGYNLLTKHEYEPIGLDHFVKKEDELYKSLVNKTLHRNFQGYCTRENTGQVYAFGVTGISQLGKAYLQHTKSIDTYIHEINSGRIPVEKQLIITNEQLIIRELITHLMCNKQLSWNNLAHYFSITTDALKKVVKYDPKKFKEFQIDGLIEFDENAIQVTEAGSLFIRNIAAALDPAYKKQINKYSKSL